MLQRRLDILEQVSTLAQQLGESGDAGYTCETAGYFFLMHVLSRWERFNAAVAAAPPDDLEAVAKHFPFTEFFATVPPPLFAGKSREEDMEAARVCWRHLSTLFTELKVRHDHPYIALPLHFMPSRTAFVQWCCQLGQLFLYLATISQAGGGEGGVWAFWLWCTACIRTFCGSLN